MALNKLTADALVDGTLDSDAIGPASITTAKLNANIISGQTAIGAVDASNDLLLIYDNDATSLKKVPVSSVGATNTDSITEGSSNLYYTNARADARAQLKIDALVASAPGTLDTLNELAAALGDDANFSTTVTNSIATKLPLAGGTMTGDIAMSTHQIVFDNNSQAIQIKDAGGTASYVLYQDNADTLILGNATNVEKIRLDTSGNEGAVVIDTNGYVGIGTTTPDQPLQVKGVIETQATNSTNGFMMYTYTDNTYRINYNGAGGDELILTSGGVLGLGNTPGAWSANYPALTIGQGATFTGHASNTQTQLGQNWWIGTGNQYIVNGAASRLVMNPDSTIKFSQAPSGTANATMSTTNDRLVIIPSGNVGIGTTGPGYKLQVDHGTTAQYASSIRNTADNLQLLLGTTTGGLLNIQGKAISSNAAYQIALQAEGGKVGIGTASPLRNISVIGSDTSSSGYKDIAEFLEPNTTGGTVSVNFGVANSLNNLGKVDFTYVGAGSTDNWVSIGFHSNDNKLKVYANGLVEVASYLKSKKGTIQTVVNQPTIYTSANPVNTWAEVHSNFRVSITPRFASGTKILGTYSVPINPTGAANILMAIQPWYSTDGGTTKTMLNQGGPSGSRLTGSHAWFRSSNGYDGNDMQNHVVHFGYTHSATTTLTWGFYFRSEGSNTTYFCYSNGNSSLWGWTAPIYMELREIEIA